MNYELVSRIKSIRETKGLTQQEVASMTGLSRPAYTNIERGKRDISFQEALRLSKALDFSLTSLQPTDELSIYRKFRSLYLAFLKRASASDGKITKTKLAKLIYFADFTWFARNNTPITGALYRHIQRGPVADLFFRVTEDLFDTGTIDIETKGAAMLISLVEPTNEEALTNEQLHLVEAIANKWRDRDTASIVQFTHDQAPWSKTSQGEIIPYELAKQIPEEKLY